MNLNLPDGSSCSHIGEVRRVLPSAAGCEECLAAGDDWVHLRLCMTCGHVGCCDTSKNRHATAHHHATGHPIVRSLEPGEDWGWCYADELMLKAGQSSPDIRSLQAEIDRQVVVHGDRPAVGGGGLKTPPGDR